MPRVLARRPLRASRSAPPPFSPSPCFRSGVTPALSSAPATLFGVHRVIDRRQTITPSNTAPPQSTASKHLTPKLPRQASLLPCAHARSPGELLATVPPTLKEHIGIVGLAPRQRRRRLCSERPKQHFYLLSRSAPSSNASPATRATSTFPAPNGPAADIRGHPRRPCLPLPPARPPTAHFAILILDAYNSDSLPTSIFITTEALALYLKAAPRCRSSPFHIGTRHLELSNPSSPTSPLTPVSPPSSCTALRRPAAPRALLFHPGSSPCPATPPPSPPPPRHAATGSPPRPATPRRPLGLTTHAPPSSRVWSWF